MENTPTPLLPEERIIVPLDSLLEKMEELDRMGRALDHRLGMTNEPLNMAAVVSRIASMISSTLTEWETKRQAQLLDVQDKLNRLTVGTAIFGGLPGPVAEQLSPGPIVGLPGPVAEQLSAGTMTSVEGLYRDHLPEPTRFAEYLPPNAGDNKGGSDAV